MNSTTGVIISRKIIVACLSIIFCSLLLPPFFYSEHDYFTGFDITFYILFWGTLFYGIGASVISDSIANKIFKKSNKLILISSGILHLLFGSLFGPITLIVAMTFFVVDRLAKHYGYKSWKVSTISLLVLIVILIFVQL